ncbi:MAG: chromosomal replication initiator protein DnaA [Bdellovibrionaceae bacterium]|nr:chromosomal replication initiator protein DnaA [Bdellovibrionales bacterium]MCB9085454.1 chromosomal replication initiator protein DnaA [Pseudobdellovibrionaceae bacterium]
MWNQIKSSLIAKNRDNKPFQAWFEETDLLDIERRDDGISCFRLGVRSELHRQWISEFCFDRICSEISAIYKSPYEIEMVVTGSPNITPVAEPEPSQNENSSSSPGVNYQKQGGFGSDPRSAVNPGVSKDNLNSEFTFSTFVVGRNNEFAHAASYSIAENPGQENYNPLFICGPTGMGKTHLLNSVGNHIRVKFPHLRICYVSAERFLNECISSIRRQEMHKFRRRYRESCDILLMDDIQILGRGEAVQEEFFHTLNDFFEKGHQVIVASDRMPKDIKGLEDRIRTRLEWGLIADITMPELETRVAILRYKAEKRGIRLPNEVVNYIARISKRSIRELEGNLNRVKMFSDLQGLEINLELAKKVLAVNDDTATLTSEDIMKLVSDHFKVRISDLKSRTRTKPIVVARQVTMWLIKKHQDKSLVEIGRLLGGKDHTTVINAIRRINLHLQKDSDLKRDIEDLEGRIHNITGL